MKAIVYTYRNKKPVFFEFDRYYYIENKRQLNKLIDRLLDVDAVISPANPIFPTFMELESGFGPSLKMVNYEDLNKEIKKLQKLLDKDGK